jgi:hypothetical protein
VTAPRINEEKWKDLLKDLRKETQDPTAKFSFVYLVDDFTASGTTLLRSEDCKWKGKLYRFWEDVGKDEMAKEVFEEDWKLCVHHYVSTSKSEKAIQERDEEVRTALGTTGWFRSIEFTAGMRLPSDFSVTRTTPVENPFLIRTAELLRDDEAFLAVVSPEPLTHHLKKAGEAGILYDRLVLMRGTPGSGKTTMARLFEYPTLYTLLRNKSSTGYKELHSALTECRAVKDEEPLILGCRLSMESDYRDIWEFPYTDEIKTNLMMSLLQARTVSWFSVNWKNRVVELQTGADAGRSRRHCRRAGNSRYGFLFCSGWAWGRQRRQRDAQTPTQVERVALMAALETAKQRLVQVGREASTGAGVRAMKRAWATLLRSLSVQCTS